MRNIPYGSARGVELMGIARSLAFGIGVKGVSSCFHLVFSVSDTHYFHLPWGGLKTGLGREKLQHENLLKVFVPEITANAES